MNDFVDFNLDQREHVITYYNKEIPYSMKDFKVDIDQNHNLREELKENYQSENSKEIRALRKMNKKIKIMR